MVDTRIDVIGIGNAIVDVLGHADDGFLREHELAKGSMTLIDAERADRLYGAIKPVTECSGGSAANTIAVLSSLGGNSAFVGKVRDDALGDVFRRDIESMGIAFPVAPLTEGPTTGRCVILVTPDAERTMNTYLGASAELSPEDIDTDQIAESQVTYLEGYLWDPPKAKEAFIKAARAAHQAGRLVSLSLSDRFCVTRHRDEFLMLVRDHVDVLFANEDEVMTLYNAETFDEALQIVRGHCGIAALTRGARGSIVVSGNEVHVLDAPSLGGVVDTTGAGDAYAGGFLYGLTQGHTLANCGRIGGIAAAEVISHFGARPGRSLKDLVRSRLG